jgi:hypothetical protein
MRPVERRAIALVERLVERIIDLGVAVYSVEVGVPKLGGMG